MPTYPYIATNPKKGCDYCRAGFELRQGIREPALVECPRCRAPIHRVIRLTELITKRPLKELLSDKNIKAHGFRKLMNEGGGKFRKV